MNGRTGAEGLTGAGEPGDVGEPAGVDRSRPSRRKVVVGTALAGIAGALPLGGGSAYADADRPAAPRGCRGGAALRRAGGPRRHRLPARRLVHRPRHRRRPVRPVRRRHPGRHRRHRPHPAGHLPSGRRPYPLHARLRRRHRDRRRDHRQRMARRLARHQDRRHPGPARGHPPDPRARPAERPRRPARCRTARRPHRPGQGRKRRHARTDRARHSRGRRARRLRVRGHRHRPAGRRRRDQHRVRQARRGHHLGERTAVAADRAERRPPLGPPRLRPVDPPRGHRTRGRHRAPAVRHRHPHPRPQRRRHRRLAGRRHRAARHHGQPARGGPTAPARRRAHPVQLREPGHQPLPRPPSTTSSGSRWPPTDCGSSRS
ncbi:hypothetical protein SRIMM317S_04717 [Streptomyces rimosus subsp. rimosus]